MITATTDANNTPCKSAALKVLQIPLLSLSPWSIPISGSLEYRLPLPIVFTSEAIVLIIETSASTAVPLGNIERMILLTTVPLAESRMLSIEDGRPLRTQSSESIIFLLLGA